MDADRPPERAQGDLVSRWEAESGAAVAKG